MLERDELITLGIAGLIQTVLIAVLAVWLLS